MDSKDYNCILPDIAVLMSTYNGEKYIKEQIDSILLQKDVNVDIYIRDDKSQDRTVSIIQEYMLKGYDNIYLDRGMENVGPGISFMSLLYKIMDGDKKYQYYSFADQDDIWLDEKLIMAVKKLETLNEPALYCSNQIIYEDGQENGLRFKDIPDLTVVNSIMHNDISGCTMVFNNELATEIVKRKMPSEELLTLRCHDTFVFLTAKLIGTVIYDSNSYIYYRIHNTNTVGLKPMSLKKRISRVLTKGMSYRNLRKKTAIYLISNYPETSKENRQELEIFAEYEKGIKEKVNLIRERISWGKLREGRLCFIIKVLIGYI